MHRVTLILLLLAACQDREKTSADGRSYGDDLAFLEKHDNTTLELRSGDARAILSARYQGRVMTTTSAGMAGNSYGWINYDLISSGQFKKQFNPVGGEERFWLGPEGGQYSLYFAPGDSFKIENWQVPPIIDTVAYQITARTDTSATFEANAQLQNHSGALFNIGITRSVSLVQRADLERELDVAIHPSVKFVGYRTQNGITNTGKEQWTRDKGLISIWLLGMFQPSASTTVIIPFLEGTDPSEINTDYFGEIPADRLTISNDVLFFKCDGKYRSKIGLPPGIVGYTAGSYDAERQVLTIISFRIDNKNPYVNSKWETQEYPYVGDAVNSYNDGPLADGSQLGPFYELESSSSVSELMPGESQRYNQVTCHFEGDFEALNQISKTLLHADLNTLKDQP